MLGGMPQPVQMEKVWAISGGMLKEGSKWLVKTKEVENMLFAQIDKWDPKFVPFVTGKAVQLRKEKDPSICSSFFIEVPVYKSA